MAVMRNWPILFDFGPSVLRFRTRSAESEIPNMIRNTIINVWMHVGSEFFPLTIHEKFAGNSEALGVIGDFTFQMPICQTFVPIKKSLNLRWDLQMGMISVESNFGLGRCISRSDTDSVKYVANCRTLISSQ
ncbi:hypothetical protein Ancab_032708 [Ancistrocladus abbreviatus]